MKAQNNHNLWLRYSSFAFQLLIMIGLSVWGGIKLDALLDVSPLLTVSLPLLVLAGIFIKLIKATTKKKNTNDKKNDA